MKASFHYILFFFSLIILQPAKSQLAADTLHEMVFVSDTQEPMNVEKIRLKTNQNLLATAKIFEEILRRKPANLYMLGDVVNVGYSNKKWLKVDRFLDSCRKEGIIVNGLLGNHDILGRNKKGEQNFNKRFPENRRTGFLSIADSVAVVMLNSNFKSLSKTAFAKQQDWYKKTMEDLDNADSILVVIVACHHAPYSNSKIVGSSQRVQNNFVPGYFKSQKAQLFVTGHAHAFEHFNKKNKDFLVIGGGGGLHQPLDSSANSIKDYARDYKPPFHFLSVYRRGNVLEITSYALNKNFDGFETGHSFITTSKFPELQTGNKDAAASIK